MFPGLNHGAVAVTTRRGRELAGEDPRDGCCHLGSALVIPGLQQGKLPCPPTICGPPTFNNQLTSHFRQESFLSSPRRQQTHEDLASSLNTPLASFSSQVVNLWVWGRPVIEDFSPPGRAKPQAQTQQWRGLLSTPLPEPPTRPHWVKRGLTSHPSCSRRWMPTGPGCAEKHLLRPQRRTPPRRT